MASAMSMAMNNLVMEGKTGRKILKGIDGYSVSKKSAADNYQPQIPDEGPEPLT
jgi:hypothetical protein